MDWALAGPVPWSAPEARESAVVHSGDSLDDLIAFTRQVRRGELPDNPYLVIGQQSLVDPSRAPAGHHTLWAYCHVPNGSTVDMTAAIDAQIERFAPGFGDLVLARHVAGPAWFEGHDAAFIGGDIAGGANDRLQLLFRPVIGRPYLTPNPSLLMCSASTPPGGGVHGMCGFHAAQAALRGVLR
jgi:phytoene dehydrogenase-like protein